MILHQQSFLPAINPSASVGLLESLSQPSWLFSNTAASLSLPFYEFACLFVHLLAFLAPPLHPSQRNDVCCVCPLLSLYRPAPLFIYMHQERVFNCSRRHSAILCVRILLGLSGQYQSEQSLTHFCFPPQSPLYHLGFSFTH